MYRKLGTGSSFYRFHFRSLAAEMLCVVYPHSDYRLLIFYISHMLVRDFDLVTITASCKPY